MAVIQQLILTQTHKDILKQCMGDSFELLDREHPQEIKQAVRDLENLGILFPTGYDTDISYYGCRLNNVTIQACIDGGKITFIYGGEFTKDNSYEIVLKAIKDKLDEFDYSFQENKDVANEIDRMIDGVLNV